MSRKAIIVGGGHNGLVAAGYLARAGLDVTVLEARAVVGGAAVTEELIAGCRMNSCSFVVGLLRPEVINDLQLKAHGLDLYLPNDAISCSIFPNGRHLFMWTDADRTLRGVKSSFGQRDMEGFMEFGLHLQQVADVLGPTVMGPPPTLSEFVRRFENAGQMPLFERFVSGSVRDLVDHYFESAEIRSHFVFPAVVSTHLGPSSPGSSFLVSYHCIGEFEGQFGSWGFARGGMGAISNALARSATAAGARIRTDAEVRRIETRAGRISGVELASGEVLGADIVISNADPRRTFLGLIGEKKLPRGLIESVRSYDMRGSMARVYLVVDELPAFIGFDSTEPGPEHEGHIFLGAATELFEAGHDAQRRGRIPEDFALELTIDTVRDPSLAPPGRHVIVIGVQQMPFDLATGDWDTEKPRLIERVIDKLVQYAPNLRARILAVHCHTPLDWERTYRLTGGNIFHGAMSMTRILAGRPGMLRNGYAAPIDGLYLCGSGTHPGGGVCGASGFNGAMAVLSDLGLPTPRPWVPGASTSAAERSRSGLLAAALASPPLRRLMSSIAASPLARPFARRLLRSDNR